MSIIAILIILFITLIAVLVAVSIFHFARTGTLVQKQEQSALTIVQLEAQLKVAQKTLDTFQQTNREQILAGTVLQEIEQAVIVLDQAGIISLFNPAAEKLTGLYRVDVLKRQYLDVLQFTDQQGKAELETIKTGLSGHAALFPKWTFVTNRTTKIPFSGTATPLTNPDGTRSVVLILRDGTQEFKDIEEEKAFFSAAAHELRSPLTTIQAVLSLLVSNIDTLPPEKTKTMLKETLEYTAHLMLLVNDYLSVSRIEQGRIEIKREIFDLSQLVKDVIAKSELQAKEHRLYLNHTLTELIPKVTADRDKTQEILTNLISNAIKYTHQGGIEITHKVEGSYVTTTVTDTGNGIAEEHHRLLFRKFQQIGTSRTLSGTKSTGLGLYIAKKLAQLMKGDLILEKSAPGVGSSFKLLLPLAPRDGSMNAPLG